MGSIFRSSIFSDLFLISLLLFGYFTFLISYLFTFVFSYFFPVWLSYLPPHSPCQWHTHSSYVYRTHVCCFIAICLSLTTPAHSLHLLLLHLSRLPLILHFSSCFPSPFAVRYCMQKVWTRRNTFRMQENLSTLSTSDEINSGENELVNYVSLF